MSKAFGPGALVPAGVIPLDRARAHYRQSRFNTSRYLDVIKVLEKAR